MRGGPIPFGKYLLVDRINVGGMAEVFLAKAFGVEGFERVLAIKRILPSLAEDDEFVAMFVDEARIAVQLSHASIVQVYELGRIDGQYYIAMEYVSGKDLRHVLDTFRAAGKTMPVPAAAFIAARLCEGLDYAHRKKHPSGRALDVVHRDVSPQNVLVSFDGAVKLTDFGIAKAEDRASRTQAGVLKGKFAYMSPEQVRGLAVDRRSDVFAVGILLYEMLTGQRLFVGESDFSTLEKVRKAEIVPPRQVRPDLPEALAKVVERALARDRDQRYAWASDLHEDLQQFLIEGGSIYNAKRLAAQLEVDFAADLERERERLAELVRVRRPESEAGGESVAPSRGHPRPSRGEDTVVFESSPQPGGAPARDRGARGESGGRGGAASRTSAPGKPSSGGGHGVRAALGAWLAMPARPRRTLVVASLLLAAAAVGLGMALGRSPRTGTIVVTTEPAEVELLLDGDCIGQRTPVTRAGIALGAHVLRARAGGYTDETYRFELDRPGVAAIALALRPRAEETREPAAASPSAARPDDPRTAPPGQPATSAPQPASPAQASAIPPAVPVAVAAEQPDPVSARASPSSGQVPAAAGPATSRPAAVPACGGTAAKLSVVARGVADCKVWVGRTLVGVAPFVARTAPGGRCRIVVTCPGGLSYAETRVLGSGAAEKLIVEASMWKREP